MSEIREERQMTCVNVFRRGAYVADLFQWSRNGRWYFDLKGRATPRQPDGFASRDEARTAAMHALDEVTA